jgi:hypothetical protein
MTENLWGSFDDITAEVSEPRDILEEQCKILQDNLKGLITGDVKRTIDLDGWTEFLRKLGVDNSFCYNFTISSDFVGKYNYDVCKIAYGVTLYPLAVVISKVVGNELSAKFTVADGDTIVAENEEEFKRILGCLFTSKEVKQVLRGLSSMANREKASKDSPF